MRNMATTVMLAYAVTLVIGGLGGWRVSGSRLSFTAGLGSAAALAVAYRISLTMPFGGYLLAAIIAAVLAIVFSLRLQKTKKILPSGLLLLLSAVTAMVMGWSAAVAW